MLRLLLLLYLSNILATSHEEAREALRRFECERSVPDYMAPCLTMLNIQRWGLMMAVNGTPGSDVWCQGAACCLEGEARAISDARVGVFPLQYESHLVVTDDLTDNVAHDSLDAEDDDDEAIQ